MALTANITTPDGVEHPNAYGLIYPMQITALDTEMRIDAGIHCWHDQAAKVAGRSELAGYPQPISLSGEAAQIALVTGLAPLAAIEWVADPVVNAGLAEAAIIAAMEAVVIGQFPMFSRL